ncbi:hypothetical protein FRB98_001253, partial [Tulasnella sp. 332]
MEGSAKEAQYECVHDPGCIIECRSRGRHLTPMRKKIEMLPRTITASSDANNANAASVAEEGEEGDRGDTRRETSETTEPKTQPNSAPKRAQASDMLDKQAKTKVKEDVKEIFGMLPKEHHSKLVNAMRICALDAKEDGARLAADVFTKVSRSLRLKPPRAAEFLEDIAIYVPQ